MTLLNYRPHDEKSCVCPDCGCIVHNDFVGKHNEWHLRLLRGTLKK